MTMSEVPTSTPAPSNVSMRSWRGESEKESGNMPARNELQLSDSGLVQICIESYQRAKNIRNAHYRAQSEQHEEAVPHGESCMLQAVTDAVKRYAGTRMKERYVVFSLYYPYLTTRREVVR
jgi:hypothetical protein